MPVGSKKKYFSASQFNDTFAGSLRRKIKTEPTDPQLSWPITFHFFATATAAESLFNAFSQTGKSFAYPKRKLDMIVQPKPMQVEARAF